MHCRTIKTGWCLMLLCSMATSGVVAADRPNIVVIMSDNQAANLLGPYGNTEIKTPHIDRLAKEGMTFDNAFAVNGVCSPTRATLMTGLTPSQTGVHRALPGQLDIEGWNAIEEFRNLPMTLKDVGYNTAQVGKYHLGNHTKPQLGFDYWVTFTSGHTTKFYNVDIIDNDKRYQLPTHMTDFWTNKAVEFIQQQSDEKPFFLFLSYNGPYILPPTVNQINKTRHAEYYNNNTPWMPQHPVHPYLMTWSLISNPSTGAGGASGVGAWPAINALNNKTAMVNIAAETTMVDDGVGKVMDSLKKEGFDDNTLVIYISDQGSSWGQHGIWGNSSWSVPGAAYDMNMQIPLIFRHPGKITAGSRSDLIVNQFDFFPTLAAYAGIEALKIENSPGRSYVPELVGEDHEWGEQAAYFEFNATRTIRTQNWKYVKRIFNLPNELYDLTADPEEINNLIDDENYTTIVKQLDDRLTAFFAEYSNPRYDLWRNGQSKGRSINGAKAKLLSAGYPNFSKEYSNWTVPIRERAQPF